MACRPCLAAPAALVALHVAASAHAQVVRDTERPPEHSPWNDPRARRVQLDLALQTGFHTRGSSYRDAARLWGYDQFVVEWSVALGALYRVSRALWVGARLAYGQTPGGEATLDGASLAIHQYDASAVLRAGPAWRTAAGEASLGLHAEGGVTIARATLRDDDTAAAVPRASLALYVNVARSRDLAHPISFDVRLGYQWLTWPDAGAEAQSLSLDGVVLSLAAGVRL